MPEQKSRLHKMLESKNSLTRSIGDLVLSAVRATGAEKRTREKLEKIENKQKEQLNTLIDALSKHVMKYKVCDKHLKKGILENKHRFLGPIEFYNKNEVNFIKQFNEFSRILKIYKGLCQYLNPKKLQSFIDLMFDGKLNSEDYTKYKNNFLNVNRTPICNLSLEDSSEESSENCSVNTSSSSSSSNFNLEFDQSRASEWRRQASQEILNINSDVSSYPSSDESSSDSSSDIYAYRDGDIDADTIDSRNSEASTIYKGKIIKK